MSEPEEIDPSLLRKGPIRHHSLPPDMLEQIKAIFDVIGRYLGTTLEQFEIDFMRDMNPDVEIAIWTSIASAWLGYHEKYLDGSVLVDAEERKLLGALIAISTGIKEPSKLGVPAETGKQLLQCYDDLRNEG